MNPSLSNKEPAIFKVAAANLQSGVSITRGYWQYLFSFWKYWFPHSKKPLGKVADFIQRNHIDISLCNEISDPSLRTGFTSQIHTIASLLPVSHTVFFKTEVRLYSVEGSAIVSTFPILESNSFPLTSGKVKRVLGYACIEVSGRKVSFFVAHLSLSAKLRHIQMKEISEIINTTEGPIILGGDFNTKDSSLSYIVETTRLKDCGAVATFPSWNPKASFDRIFVSEELFCHSLCADPSSLFSDHQPIVAELSFI